MNRDFLMLMTLVRETKVSAGYAADLFDTANRMPDGLPLEQVQHTLRVLTEHLESAVALTKQLYEKSQNASVETHQTSQGLPAVAGAEPPPCTGNSGCGT